MPGMAEGNRLEGRQTGHRPFNSMFKDFRTDLSVRTAKRMGGLLIGSMTFQRELVWFLGS